MVWLGSYARGGDYNSGDFIADAPGINRKIFGEGFFKGEDELEKRARRGERGYDSVRR